MGMGIPDGDIVAKCCHVSMGSANSLDFPIRAFGLHLLLILFLLLESLLLLLLLVGFLLLLFLMLLLLA